jgi:hypothetical protein
MLSRIQMLLLTSMLYVLQFNLSQCLTPTGIPYVTNRGGPLVGEELLLLQGIPADDLVLTKESESNLSDLAGNAMTTCVVGACILSGLLHGHDVLMAQGAPSDEEGGCIVSSLVPRPLGPPSEVSITQQFGDYEDKILDLGQAHFVDEAFLSNLLLESWLSSRKCVDEGPDESISDVLECQDCGQTASVEAANPPRNYEQHNFAPMDIDRVHPPTFRAKLLSALPTMLRIRSLDVREIEKPEDVKGKIWMEWQERVVECVSSQFRFAQLDRRHYWSVIYRSSSGTSRLELRLYKSYAEWLLFAEAPCKRGPLRDFLERPVARFHVVASSGSILVGKCEVRLPVMTTTSITVEAIGKPTESWRQRLGLKGEFETETQFEKLRVTLDGADDVLKATVDGVYEYLPLCGGACGSTHKKQQDSSSESPLFFLLESGRATLPKDGKHICLF